MRVPIFETKRLLKGWAGFATPFFIVVNDKTNERLIRHEMCHVKQWWRGWIIGFAVMYLYYLAKRGYYDNPYEIEAREVENGTSRP
jgi:hypothetical protein